MNTNFEKQIISDELEKYKVENALLHEKLKSLESIIEDAATAIIIGNNKGFIIDGNKKIQELTQYSREELCQKKLNQILIKDHVPESFSRKNPKEPSDEFASEQILLLKNEKKIFVSVRTKLLSDGRYQLIINDINKRKKAELALIESEKKYRLLTENIHDVVWNTSKNLKIKYISPSIYKVTDYDAEVYYVKRLHEIMTPISYQLLRETLRKQSELNKTGTLSTSENQVSIEIKLIHRRQKNIWVEVIATSILNHLGESIGFQGVMRNIDDKKRAQEILEKNKQRYNFAVRSAGAGVWELDASLTRINIDENLLNILGYEKNEIKPLLNNWINITIKSDRRYLIDVLQDILDGEKLSMSYECRRIHKSGEIIWFRDYVEAIADENGKVIELIGTSKNISLEKTNEEKKYRYYAGLQILIDSAFNFLKLTDVSKICNYAGKILLQNVPDSIIIFSNIDHDKKESKPRQIYGVNEANLKDLLKKIPFVPHERSIVLPDKEFSLLEKKTLLEYDGGFPAFINKVFNNEEAKLINETFNFNKFYIIGITQNDKLTHSISIITRKNKDIGNKEFIEAFINLTSIIINRKNIETELQNLNITKDKFFSIISHDLKNPFNTFIGFSGLMIQNIDTISKEKILEFSKLIHNGALQSYEMMQNLFDWVKSQQKGIVVRPVEIMLTELLMSIIKLFSSEARKKNIKLSLKTNDRLNILSDIDMLNTILRNLVSNALKFTNKDGEIQISFQKSESEIQFNIIDNGIGMTAEKQSELFDVHTNTSSSGTEYEKGTGLGLVLCKEFIDLLKGKIWVESELGKGTRFSFIIPQ